MSRLSWGMVVLGAALCAPTVTGCAGERDPINRVQANALDKSFLVGAQLGDPADDPEFYSAATVIDVPYGADQGSVFAGLVGSLSRVKWEITETTLNARLSYEEIDGVDGHGARTGRTGEVLAAWPIESHFDIRRSYNPATGEELNVVEENTSDRPWYERQYMRVDWSASSIQTSRMWDAMQGEGFDTEPLRYYVSDPAHPDAPVFSVTEGYFDITNKIFLSPRSIEVNGTTLPACLFRGSFVLGATYPWGNCENSEITVRYAFRRVWQEGEPGYTDYEPKHWDGSRMEAAGAFTQDRLGWDRNYGIVDEKWRRFAQRYNIWQRSHTDVPCATPESYAIGCDPKRDGDLDCNGTVDPAIGETPDGTHDECVDAGAGSKCDELAGKCTIPYALRTVKTVPWHFTVNREDDIIYESTEMATWQWDSAMRQAVQVARYTECVKTGTLSLAGSKWDGFVADGLDLPTTRGQCGFIFHVDQSYDDAALDTVRDINMCVKGGTDKATCLKDGHAACLSAGTDAFLCDVRYGENSVAAMEPVVVICDNPVAATDHASCGAPGTIARPGDIRYHQLNAWPTRQTLSPWGYGPSLADPLTGEIISAGINIYNSATDSAAQAFLDQIRWINGELSSTDVTTGKHVHDWVQSDAYSHAQSGALMDKHELEARVSGLGGVDTRNVERTPELAQKLDPKHLINYIRELEREVVPPGVLPENRAVFEERIQKAKESGVEAELMNDMWLQMAAADPDLDWADQVELASPLRGMDSRAMLHAYEAGQQHFAAHGQCLLAAPEPTALPALAKVMDVKFPVPVADDFVDGSGNLDKQAFAEASAGRLKRMWDYLRYKMNYDVILHEMGHTVGLRHNFVSSYDKYNYKPQYWQLRDNAGRQTALCTGPVADGSTCVGPRWYDPLSQDEIDNAIWTWQQTSVMDYAGDLTQDMLGLGVYDKAAARMIYSDVVDVRTDVEVGKSVIGDDVEALVDYPGYLFGQIVESRFVPYYEYNSHFKLVQPERCYAHTPVQPAWWDQDKLGVWDPVFDGNVVHNERCTRPPVDYMQWEDMVADQINVDFDDPEYFTPRRARDIHNRPRVPYGFLSDEYADGWSASAYRHDNGADIYEEMVFHSNLYENRHIFENFRNGRSTFTVYGAYQRALARYHVKVENLTQGFAYSVDFILREFAKTIGAPFATVIASNAGEGSFLWEHSVAAAAGFDHFVRVLTRPHSGAHYCQTGTGGGLGTACDPAGTRVLKPAEDEIGGVPADHHVAGYMTNGPLAAGDYISYGGKPLNNDFQYAHGYWSFDYLNQSGSYYEKTYAIQSMLNASYGAINFFRWDGVDARFRHTNFSDLFPDGMRRLIGVSLTEDYGLLGPRLSSNGNGQPDTTLHEVSGFNYPSRPLAWLSFVPKDGPVACSPSDGVLSCTDSFEFPIGNGAPAEADAWVVDPQVGYEVQKFIVFWFYVYQPGREMLDWVDLLRIYRTGSDVDPDYLPTNTVEWRDPESGYRYIAKRFGDEDIFGKTYDKGIAAKMIQWANQLSGEVYQLDAVTPFDPDTGAANVLFDAEGLPLYIDDDCENNRKCEQLRRYRGLLDFTRDTAARLGFPEPSLQVISPDD